MRSIVGGKQGIVILAALALGGCVTTPAPPLVSQPDPVLLELTAVAQRAATDIQNLREIQSRRSGPSPALPDLEGLPESLTQLVTMSWDGPIAPLLRSLSGLSGFSLQEVGAPPAVPIIVRIAAAQKPLIHVLADVGYQAGDRATVRVSTSAMEILYAGR